jgi:hypothetical protein
MYNLQQQFRAAAEKKRCSEMGCGDNAVKRGMCDYHYKKWVRTEEAKAAIAAPDRRLRLEHMSAIYVIGYLETCYVKIGISQDVRSRINGMQTGCPFPMMPFAALYSGREEVTLVEALTHKTLAQLGIDFRGEWFDVPPLDAIAVISKIADKNGIYLNTPREMLRKIGEQEYDFQVADQRIFKVESLRWIDRAIEASLGRLAAEG